MLKKIAENFMSKKSKGEAGIIVLMLIVLVVIFALLIWFLCACHGWLVLAFPTFTAFPRWAFVLLMFILAGGSSSGNNSK